MAERETPRLALPFRFVSGRAATVPQDSDDDVLQCVEVVLSYQPGSRPEAPTFGAPGSAHRQAGASMEDVVAAVNEWEDRADAVASRLGLDLEGLVERVRLTSRRPS